MGDGGGGGGNISMESGCQKLGKCSKKGTAEPGMGVVISFSLGPHEANGRAAICSEGKSRRE